MKKVVIYTGPMCNFCSAAKHLLNKGGVLVIKIFDGKETVRLCNSIKKKFLQFNLYKPTSSKSESKEIYIITKFLK